MLLLETWKMQMIEHIPLVIAASPFVAAFVMFMIACNNEDKAKKNGTYQEPFDSWF